MGGRVEKPLHHHDDAVRQRPRGLMSEEPEQMLATPPRPPIRTLRTRIKAGQWMSGPTLLMVLLCTKSATRGTVEVEAYMAARPTSFSFPSPIGSTGTGRRCTHILGLPHRSVAGARGRSSTKSARALQQGGRPLPSSRYRRQRHLILASRESSSSDQHPLFPSSDETLLNQPSVHHLGDGAGAGDVTRAQAPLVDQSDAEKAYLVVEEEVTLDDVYEQAIRTTLLWVFAASLFGLSLFHFVSPRVGEEFFAGYLVEQSLSVDNLFVFLLLFEYFGVPLAYQNRVLSWGIIGAVGMRGVMIGLGAVALERFHGILLVFAAFLVYSAVQTLVGVFNEGGDGDGEESDMGDDLIVRFSRKLFPSTNFFDGDRFFTVVDGVKMATPLFLCMIAVEISDVVFAVDSIPAVFGVTENPLVVFSSNLFAIMGLRSLYTVLSKAAADLEYLEPAVALVLGFIGSKMCAEYFGYCIPTFSALVVVSTLLSGGVGLSLLKKRRLSDAEGEQPGSL